MDSYSSYKELTLLFLLICIAGLLFSSTVYFIESDQVRRVPGPVLLLLTYHKSENCDYHL